MNNTPPIHRAPWAWFRSRHLPDYPDQAAWMWLVLAALGAAALAAAGARVWHHPVDVATLVGGLLVVACLAWFPVRIPRARQSVLVADVFIFLMLAHLGAPAAVLAAGVEGFFGALRTSKRWSTRISGPATAMAAMTVCGWCYEGLLWLGAAAGLGPDLALVAALCVVGALPAVLSTGSLMWLMALKQHQRLSLGDWFDNSFWFVAMVVGAAFVAALVEINARRAGVGMLAVVAVLSLTMVMLLRRALARQEARQAVQDAQLAQAQAEADANMQRFSAAFAHAAVGMAIVRPGGKMLQVNQALCDLLCSQPSELLGRSFDELIPAADAARLEAEVAQVIAGVHGAFSMELRCSAATGEVLWAALHCGRFADPQASRGGEDDCLIYQLHDITARHVAESRLHHIAFHDGLTDLANRHCFHDRLTASIERCRRDPNHRFAVLFLDLDRFKMVNDSLGHEAGNQLLREVGDRMLRCVRISDLVARLGGDEFAVLLEGTPGDAAADSDGQALKLAERVLQALAEPVPINGTEVIPGASIGLTFSDLGIRNAGEVLRDADLAMYEAKAAGRGRFAVFDQSMHDKVAEKLALETDLRHAIGEGQLSVHFQPLYDLEPYRLSGFEALARWTHPKRGVVSPAVFITLAEETGHIEALTDWVIDHAVAQLSRWQGSAAGTLGMHINISGRDLARPSLVGHVQQVLAKYKVRPSHLTLEITETTLMGQLDKALITLHKLREHGVRFSIDDFGTGYSSLAYLSTLPINSLKIDRSFVMGMADKPGNVEIIRAVLTLGQSLGHKVIAEGIETIEQLNTLRELGVHVGQGYLLSRPLRAEQVTEMLAVTGVELAAA
ncbi:MAG TPA: EAL domain-containing protein [Rubrivivax sp.]|nr:EAL domain-containing protein [Rubrivivax sp.]